MTTLTNWILNSGAGDAGRIPHRIGDRDTPKLKFTFTVEFKFRGINPHKGDKQLDVIRYDLKTATRPNITINYEDVNYYNYRAKVATHTNFGSVTLTFYEDSLNKANDLLWQYINSVSPVTKSNSEITTGSAGSNNRDISTIGPIPHRDGPIAWMKVHHHYYSPGKQPSVTTYTLLNPKIDNIRSDELDMSQSEASTVSVTFFAEAIHVEHGN